MNDDVTRRRKQPSYEATGTTGNEEAISDEKEDVEQATYTVGEAVEAIGFGLFQIKIVCICGLLLATDSLEMALIGVLVPYVRCEWFLSDWQVAFLSMLLFICVGLGSFSWGICADKYGRHPVVALSALMVFWSGMLSAIAPSYVWLLIARGMVGFYYGGAIQAYTYMSEFIPSKYRAKTLVLSYLSWALGSNLEVVMAMYIIPSLGWRYLVAFTAVPAGIAMIAVWLLPESARFLAAAGRIKDAKQVLTAAAKSNNSSLPPGELVMTKEPRGRFVELFSSTYCRTTLIMWSLWFGASSMTYGLTLLNSQLLEDGTFCEKGSSPEPLPDGECHCLFFTASAFKSMLISSSGEFLVVFVNFFCVDWLGRRRTILLVYCMTAIIFYLLNICMSLPVYTGVIFSLRIFAHATTSVKYIYTSEVYPTTIRALGIGTCSVWSRVGAMMTPLVAQVMVHYSTHAAVSTYGSLAAFCACASLLLNIETKGRQLPQSVNSPVDNG